MQNADNVTSIETKRPQAHATHTVSYVLDGFPVTTTIETTADIQAVLARLKAIGATPPERVFQKVETPTDDAPVCEFHGKMKRSNHGGWFCSRKMGDGSYCKSKG